MHTGPLGQFPPSIPEQTNERTGPNVGVSKYPKPFRSNCCSPPQTATGQFRSRGPADGAMLDPILALLQTGLTSVTLAASLYDSGGCPMLLKHLSETHVYPGLFHLRDA